MLRRRRRSLDCREMVELVTDYLEDAMPARRRARFEDHLSSCPHCREYLAEMRKTLEVLGRIEPDDLTDDARDELIALYRRWRVDPVS